MDWLRTADIDLFRLINRDLAHPWLDGWMRFLSSNPYFAPACVGLGLLLLWRGGARGIVFLLVLGITVGLSNELIVEPLKTWVSRSRPFACLPDVFLRVGKGSPQASMPSGHALLSACIATVTAWYYPRLRWGAVAVAFAVGLSRAYNGVHFPSDILAGWTLGVSGALGLMHLQDWAWRRWAPRWVPKLFRRVPSLLHPDGPRTAAFTPVANRAGPGPHSHGVGPTDPPASTATPP